MPESGVLQVEAPKSLVSKLAAACEAVGGIEKRGHNIKQNYDYVKAADVAKSIRHELFQRNVILLADEKELTVTGEIPTQSGGKLRELTLKVEYTLHDGDSDAKLTVAAYGVAMDTGDKAVYKAKTGALKYFLRGLGLIPDEKDDPEGDETVDRETAPRERAPSPPPRATRLPVQKTDTSATTGHVQKADKRTEFAFGANEAAPPPPAFQATDADVPSNIGDKPSKDERASYANKLRDYGVDMQLLGAYVKRKTGLEDTREISKQGWLDLFVVLDGAKDMEQLLQIIGEVK